MNIVSMMPKLKEELRTIFNDYGLKYVFDTNSQEIKVIKEKKYVLYNAFILFSLLLNTLQK